MDSNPSLLETELSSVFVYVCVVVVVFVGGGWLLVGTSAADA